MSNGGRTDGPPSRVGEGPPDLGYDLGVLDPGREDSNYWARFRIRVMTGAADELARRRGRAGATVLELVQSWSRVLVPAAAVAAAVTALELARGGAPRASDTHGPEEVLTQELEDRTLPDFLALEEAGEDVFLLAGGAY